MMESVHPVLECYNYSKQDVLQLVRRLQHREDLIHSEVARVIEESTGHEQGSWKMVGGSKKPQQLWFAILQAQIETGTPYMLYKDACNRKSTAAESTTFMANN